MPIHSNYIFGFFRFIHLIYYNIEASHWYLFVAFMNFERNLDFKVRTLLNYVEHLFLDYNSNKPSIIEGKQ